MEHRPAPCTLCKVGSAHEYRSGIFCLPVVCKYADKFSPVTCCMNQKWGCNPFVLQLLHCVAVATHMGACCDQLKLPQTTSCIWHSACMPYAHKQHLNADYQVLWTTWSCPVPAACQHRLSTLYTCKITHVLLCLVVGLMQALKCSGLHGSGLIPPALLHPSLRHQQQPTSHDDSNTGRAEATS